MEIIITYKDKSEKIFDNANTMTVIEKESIEICLADGVIVQVPSCNIKDLQIVFTQENLIEEDTFEGFEELSDNYEE